MSINCSFAYRLVEIISYSIKEFTKTVAEQEKDAGLDDKYDWNASTEGDKEATYEDAWTFESLEAELESVLNEDQTVEEGVNISVQSGMEGQEDRVSVNATDAEADVDIEGGEAPDGKPGAFVDCLGGMGI